MCDAIRHRGPDDWGVFLEGGTGLGMRRLSIIDLATGDQPLGNEDGTIQVVFNGEIYNFAALREELVARGHTFRSHSDTEVIIHLYEETGPRVVERLPNCIRLRLRHESAGGTDTRALPAIYALHLVQIFSE